MELQYIDLIKRIIDEGVEENTRNGVTISTFGEKMVFDLSEGTLPLLTTKRVAWKTCFRELMWFVKGDTSNEKLQQQKVKIWDDNASRSFLDGRGLTHLKENDLGPVYGHQWRHFNAEYTDCDTDYTNKGIDQLKNIINALKDETQHTSRRLIMSAWNPCQIDQMALPPCHVLVQFKVIKSKYLCCALYQRSGDVGLGVPFNIASYSFLTHILAHHCGLVAHRFVHFLGDAHIYKEHVEPLQTQIDRTPYDFPKIRIGTKRENIEDYTENDIIWVSEYKHHEDVKMKMIA